jgi:hypothetical protein
MKNKQPIFILRYLAVAGNILFILWILYNGINEGFNGTVPEIISYIGLVLLLGLNSALLLLASRKDSL